MSVSHALGKPIPIICSVPKADGGEDEKTFYIGPADLNLRAEMEQWFIIQDQKEMKRLLKDYQEFVEPNPEELSAKKRELWHQHETNTRAGKFRLASTQTNMERNEDAMFHFMYLMLKRNHPDLAESEAMVLLLNNAMEFNATMSRVQADLEQLERGERGGGENGRPFPKREKEPNKREKEPALTSTSGPSKVGSPSKKS